MSTPTLEAQLESANIALKDAISRLTAVNTALRPALIDCGIWMAAQLHAQDSQKWVIEIYPREVLAELRRCETQARARLAKEVQP